MSLNKILSAVLILLVSAALLVSCSADDLQKMNSSLGRLDNAGLGTAGDTAVKEASDTINSFVEDFENCFSWYDPVFVEEEETGRKLATGFDIIKDTEEDPDDFDGNARIVSLARDAVRLILKAKESKASDKALREALSARYDGDLKEGPVFRKVEDAVTGFNGSDPTQLLGFVLQNFSENAEERMNQIRQYPIPMPFSTYDMLILMDKGLMLMFRNVQFFSTMLGLYKQDNSDEGKAVSRASLNLDVIKYIPAGIASSVGEREYQTVGDKIAIAIIYDMMDALGTVCTRFSDDNQEALNLDWILKNNGDQIDRITSNLYAIAYIYDFRIDVAGFLQEFMAGL